MKNFVFGYARVSTEQQNLDRQLDMLQKYGVDFIYNEKMTGTKRNRPELEKLLERLAEGDTVVVESLFRISSLTPSISLRISRRGLLLLLIIWMSRLIVS